MTIIHALAAQEWKTMIAVVFLFGIKENIEKQFLSAIKQTLPCFGQHLQSTHTALLLQILIQQCSVAPPTRTMCIIPQLLTSFLKTMRISLLTNMSTYQQTYQSQSMRGTLPATTKLSSLQMLIRIMLRRLHRLLLHVLALSHLIQHHRNKMRSSQS